MATEIHLNLDDPVADQASASIKMANHKMAAIHVRVTVNNDLAGQLHVQVSNFDVDAAFLSANFSDEAGADLAYLPITGGATLNKILYLPAVPELFLRMKFVWSAGTTGNTLRAIAAAK